MTDIKRIKVADLTPSLKEVCIERGRNEDELLTPHEIMREWSAWYLGDAWWAESIISYYEDLTND